jgi:hypothetical protein
LHADLIGLAVAGWLRRSWSAEPSPVLPTDDRRREAKSVLVAAGAGGLAWRVAASSAAKRAESADELRRKQGRIRLQGQVAELQLARTVELMDRARVRWFLAKGWAAARLYPDTGDRPCGDFDAFVHPHDLPAATAALQRATAGGPL